MDGAALAAEIKQWGRSLGFQAVGIADCDLSAAEPRLLEWLARGWHGEMQYMARHGARRARPAELVPGTLRAICCRMDYLQAGRESDAAQRAVVARYARGRDYHRLLRARLQALCERIEERVARLDQRASLDHAEQLEYHALWQARGDAHAVPEGIDEAVAILRDPVRFFDGEQYARAVDTIDAGLRVISAAHAPLQLDFTGYRTPFAFTTPEEIAHDATPERGATPDERNP